MPDADRTEGFALTADGIALRTIRWDAVGPAWATLLIVHGLGEHAGRYDHVARQMAGAGIEVHDYDLRGFGASSGPRAYVSRWSTFHDDLEARLHEVVREPRPPPRPLWPLDGRPDRARLCTGGAPSGASRAHRAHVVRARLDHRALEGDRRTRSRPDRAAPANPERVQRRRSVARSRRRGSARGRPPLTAELHRPAGCRRLCRAGPCPRDRRHRCADPCADVRHPRQRGPHRPGRRLGAPSEGRSNVTRRVYPGLRHETHNEPEGKSVVGDTTAWLREAVVSRR